LFHFTVAKAHHHQIWVLSRGNIDVFLPIILHSNELIFNVNITL